MKYIRSTPNASGAYPAPQSNPGPDLIPISDEQLAMIIQYNGYVTITPETDEAGAVHYQVSPNTEAWEAWKASQEESSMEEPQSTLEERVTVIEQNIQNLASAMSIQL